MKAKKCQNLKSLLPPFLSKTMLRCFSGHFRIASYYCLQNKLNWNHFFTPELAQLETGYFFFSGLHWQGMYRGLIRLRVNCCSDGRRFGWQSGIYSHCFAGSCFDLQLSRGSHQTWPQWIGVSFTKYVRFLEWRGISRGRKRVHKWGIFLCVLKGLYKWNTGSVF